MEFLLTAEAFPAERALELEAAASPPVAVDARVAFKLGQWLRYVDDFAGARGYLELAERAALDEGDESSLANILLNRTLLECWSGNWSIAAALGDQTHELFQLTGISVGASNVWRAYVDAHYGRVDAVRAAALQAGGVGEPIGRMLWERAVGLAELAAGDARAAAPHLAAAVEALDAAHVAAAIEAAREVGISIEGKDHSLSPEEISLVMEPLQGYEVEAEAGHAVALQLELDEELRREGLAREIVHAIQNARKGAGLDVSDRIELRLGGDEELLEVSREHQAYIAGETLATEVAYDGAGADAIAAPIEGRELSIGVSRSS